MRLNDFRREAERFTDIDRAVLRHIEAEKQDVERHGFCSRCHDHAVFTLDPETYEWLSGCCGAREVPEEAPGKAD